MRIFRAIGLGMVIIILQFLVPTIFAGFEHTLLRLFATLDMVMVRSELVMQTGAVIPNADYLIPR
ncbi:MAG: hypothetical protein NTY66_02905 [Candidatus Vogelbacteria bacterium]|nr:hypothetical protein [Candidatus Vogelbacteria bacterium]